MSEPNVLVSYRLRDQPLRFRWFATDGVPGDGYKPQITAIRFDDGTRLVIEGSAIVEQTAPDPSGGLGAYLLTFNGIIGYAADHPDRKRIDSLLDDEIGYDLEFVHERDGRVAVLGEDYKIVDKPRGMANKLTRRGAP